MRIAIAPDDEEDDPCTARLVGPGDVRPLPPAPPSTRGGAGGGPLEVAPASPAHDSGDSAGDRGRRARLRRRTGGAKSPLSRRSKVLLALCLALAVLVAVTVAITSIMGNSRRGAGAGGPTRGGDEPNPPPLPDTMRLYLPPRTPEEAKRMRAEIERLASDPTVTWEEHAAGTGGDGGEDGATSADRAARPRPGGYPESTYTTARHFSSRRTALLFAPGTYRGLDFEVGYYTSVIGLGTGPDDVLFAECVRGPHVPALEKYTSRPPWGSGLDTFWRSMENVAVDAEEGTTWAVSQAAPIRRVHVLGDLNLFDGDSWASGGVAANCAVDGTVNLGGQQQWLFRNVEVGERVEGGAWSVVYVGCAGGLQRESDGSGGGPSVTRVDAPAVRVEKPYVVLQQDPGRTDGRADGEPGRPSGASQRDVRGPDARAPSDIGRFQLRVPRPAFGAGASGPDHAGLTDEVRDFSGVRLGVPSDSKDAAEAARLNHESLQGALDGGKDLVLSPGIYRLEDTLTVGHDGQVVLGLGYATLVAPPGGGPCVRVLPGVRGARVAGVMLESPPRPAGSAGVPSREGSARGGANSLLEWGDPAADDAGDPSDPGVLSDVFVRVGGADRDVVPVDAMVGLHSGNVYGDNLWLWRADHVALADGEGPNFPGISRRYRQTVG